MIDAIRFVPLESNMSRAGPWSIFGAAFCLGVLAELPGIYDTLPFWASCSVVVLAMAAWIPVCATVIDPGVRGWFERKLDVKIVTRHASSDSTSEGHVNSWWEAESGPWWKKALVAGIIFPVGMLVIIAPIVGLLARMAFLVNAAPK